MMSDARAQQAVRAAAALLLLTGLAVVVGDNGAGVLAVALLVLGGAAALGALGWHPTGPAGAVSSVTEPLRPAPRAGLHTARAACWAGGSVMLTGLALGQVHGVSTALAAEISLAGVMGSVVMLAPELAGAVRRFGPAVLRFSLVLVGLALLAALGVLVGGALARLWPVVVLLVIAGAGLVLVADTLGAQVRGTGRAAGGRRHLSRGVIGAVMVVWAGVLGIVLAGTQSSGHPWLVVLSAVVIVIAVVVLLGTPLLIASVTARRRLTIERLLDVDRQRISADLHDSVLQTLALVQRQAADSVAVARLARRQEHALRAWMAGEAELMAGSLAGAIRDVAANVEDDLALVIELAIIGDRAARSGDEVLLAAMREALRNVARHAPGSVANVFSEITADGVAVYVLDEGPGFIADEVPVARRGIRDAIVGRMAAVGGSAEINTTPGQGTEVQLRLPAT